MALTKVTGSMSLRTVVSKTTTYSATLNDDVILCSGSAFTVTLPAASTAGKQILLKKTDSSLTNVITIARAGSDTITDNTSGLTSTTLNTMGEAVTLVSDGTSTWQLISRDYSKVNFAWTPTGGWNTNVSFNGFWKRLGSSMFLRAQAVLSGAPNSTTFTITPPATIDVANMATTTTNLYIPTGGGAEVVVAANAAAYSAQVVVMNSTTIELLFQNATTGGQGLVNQNSPITFANGNFVTLWAEIPILGWN